MGSTPTVAKSKPRSKETKPFSGEPPEAKTPAVSPKTATQKYSNDENGVASAAMPVAPRISKIVPMMPPTAEPIALMPRP